MIAKSFMSSNGDFIGIRGDHADQGRAYLASIGVTPKDYSDIYTQMFSRGFARISVDGNDFHIERPQGLSSAQKSAVEDRLIAGFSVFVNDRRYTESKENNHAKTLIDQLVK